MTGDAIGTSSPRRHSAGREEHGRRYPESSATHCRETTRDRILLAARRELARYGAAGTRINRIAESAHTSKERLYAHFATKEQLLTEVRRQWRSAECTEQVLRGDDLPGYAGQLFDHYVQHPDHVRLDAWSELESLGAQCVNRTRTLSAQIAEIQRGQQLGRVDQSWDPFDLLVLMNRIARQLAARPDTAGAPPGRSVQQRRRVVTEAVKRVTDPPLR